MVESHDKLFRGWLFGSALVGRVESIRLIGDRVALVHGTGSVQVAWRSRLPKRRLTRNTIVAVRDADGWLFTAIHNGTGTSGGRSRAGLDALTDSAAPRPGV